ncbi:LysR family transcriptional regulator [Sinanaerobacter sp. ZZT-01]|uniref:LysR family transcriptional regulator n=1 Tax=Sinanaerobacter sp. ZZT-01 TaxID=3111540 RepID=UPI002D7760C0|nr:LysR family transcriptional regulator [Sinanaerobacter sp. ZZT-01]WRR94709.1 LysR family transcriptional regulator [Sinanaerobacter sp. ZZT-01]
MKYIIETSKHQSFSEASKALFISQSTLSTAIKSVEESLGIILFHRNNRGVTLTYDGEDYLKYAKEIVYQSEQLEQRYQSRKYLPMRFSVSTQRLPFAVRSFTKLTSDLNLDTYDIAIRECPTYSVIHDVATHRSELGILSIHNSYISSIKKVLVSYNLCFNEISQLKPYVFINSLHPLATKKSISLEDLEPYPFVTYDQKIDLSHFTEEILFYKLLNRNIHVSDRCTKIALVRNCNCFSIGPDLTNSNADIFHKGLGEILAIPLKNFPEPLHLGYISLISQPLSKLSKQYLRYLESDVKTIAKL